jgi:acetyl-CoA synthetase
LAGVTPTKPGSASLPFFGIEPAIIDPVSGEEIHGNDVEGVLAIKQSWPSMTRTVWGAHKRYMDTYLNVYKGYYVSESQEPRTTREQVLLTQPCL